MDEKQLELEPEVVFAGDTRQRMKVILADLRRLVNDPGWAYTATVLRAQAATRYVSIGRMSPRELPEFIEQVSARGEAYAMELLADLPEHLIGMFEVELQEDATEETEDDLG